MGRILEKDLWEEERKRDNRETLKSSDIWYRKNVTKSYDRTQI